MLPMGKPLGALGGDEEVDALLEFDCSAQDLNNGVINCSFMLLFRDLIRSQMQVISILRIIFIQVVCLLQ